MSLVETIQPEALAAVSLLLLLVCLAALIFIARAEIGNGVIVNDQPATCKATYSPIDIGQCAGCGEIVSVEEQAFCPFCGKRKDS